MKKSIKIIICCASIFTLIAVVAGLICCMIYSLSPPDKNKAERFLARDKADMVLITEYFIKSNYLEIYINESSAKKGSMFTGLETRDVKIEDTTVAEAIDRLFEKRGYKGINRDGNTISFLIWTRLMDFGSGIAYSINGQVPDDMSIQFLTKLEPLDKENWYYYEEDYNEWKNR